MPNLMTALLLKALAGQPENRYGMFFRTYRLFQPKPCFRSELVKHKHKTRIWVKKACFFRITQLLRKT